MVKSRKRVRPATHGAAKSRPSDQPSAPSSHAKRSAPDPRPNRPLLLISVVLLAAWLLYLSFVVVFLS